MAVGAPAGHAPRGIARVHFLVHESKPVVTPHGKHHRRRTGGVKQRVAAAGAAAVMGGLEHIHRARPALGQQSRLARALQIAGQQHRSAGPVHPHHQRAVVLGEVFGRRRGQHREARRAQRDDLRSGHHHRHPGGHEPGAGGLPGGAAARCAVVEQPLDGQAAHQPVEAGVVVGVAVAEDHRLEPAHPQVPQRAAYDAGVEVGSGVHQHRLATPPHQHGVALPHRQHVHGDAAGPEPQAQPHRRDRRHQAAKADPPLDLRFAARGHAPGDPEQQRRREVARAVGAHHPGPARPAGAGVGAVHQQLGEDGRGVQRPRPQRRQQQSYRAQGHHHGSRKGGEQHVGQGRHRRAGAEVQRLHRRGGQGRHHRHAEPLQAATGHCPHPARRGWHRIASRCEGQQRRHRAKGELKSRLEGGLRRAGQHQQRREAQVLQARSPPTHQPAHQQRCNHQPRPHGAHGKLRHGHQRHRRQQPGHRRRSVGPNHARLPGHRGHQRKDHPGQPAHVQARHGHQVREPAALQRQHRRLGHGRPVAQQQPGEQASAQGSVQFCQPRPRCLAHLHRPLRPLGRGHLKKRRPRRAPGHPAPAQPGGDLQLAGVVGGLGQPQRPGEVDPRARSQARRPLALHHPDAVVGCTIGRHIEHHLAAAKGEVVNGAGEGAHGGGRPQRPPGLHRPGRDLPCHQGRQQHRSARQPPRQPRRQQARGGGAHQRQPTAGEEGQRHPQPHRAHARPRPPEGTARICHPRAPDLPHRPPRQRRGPIHRGRPLRRPVACFCRRFFEG